MLIYDYKFERTYEYFIEVAINAIQTAIIAICHSKIVIMRYLHCNIRPTPWSPELNSILLYNDKYIYYKIPALILIFTHEI